MMMSRPVRVGLAAASCLLGTTALGCAVPLVPGEAASTVTTQADRAHRVSPRLAMDAHGNQVLVTATPRRDGEVSAIQVSTRPSGGNWSAPRQLAASAGGLSAPSVSMSRTGWVAVAWSGPQTHQGADAHVSVRLRRPDGTWLSGYTQPTAGRGTPLVQVNDRGDAVLSGPSQLGSVSARRQGRWRVIQQDSTARAVAIDGAGRVYEAWTYDDERGVPAPTYFRSNSPQGQWSTRRTVQGDNSWFHIAMTVTPDGKITLAVGQGQPDSGYEDGLRVYRSSRWDRAFSPVLSVAHTLNASLVQNLSGTHTLVTFDRMTGYNPDTVQNYTGCTLTVRDLSWGAGVPVATSRHCLFESESAVDASGAAVVGWRAAAEAQWGATHFSRVKSTGVTSATELPRTTPPPALGDTIDPYPMLAVLAFGEVAWVHDPLYAAVATPEGGQQLIDGSTAAGRLQP